MKHGQKEALNELMKYQFAVLELALFLDTHPNDQVALDKHRKYSRKANELKNQFEKTYGPLTFYYPSKKYWEYIKSPWPWEINY